MHELLKLLPRGFGVTKKLILYHSWIYDKHQFSRQLLETVTVRLVATFVTVKIRVVLVERSRVSST